MPFNRAGTRASNISAFKAEFATYIKTDAAGVRYVDVPGFTQYILGQFELGINTSANAQERETLRATSNLQQRAQQIASALDAAYKSVVARPDFPANGTVTGNSARVDAMEALKTQSMAVVKDIEAQYQNKLSRLETTLTDIFNRDGISSYVDIAPPRTVDTRFYLITFVTDRGEESAPSPVSDLLEVDQNDSVTLTRPSVPTGRFIQKWRVYRSNVGTVSADFQFVDDVLLSSNTFTDLVKSEALGEICETITWREPPYRADNTSSATIKPPKGADPYLRGIVGMPNGVMAGFIDNIVAFCQPYAGYAWPVGYQQILEYQVVGLGVFGQTLFVGTTANPYLISGSDSASMSAQKLDAAQACASRRSIVAAEGGVLYASQDGICFASANGVEIVTRGLYAREDWQLLNPASIVAAAHEGVYYFFYSGAGSGCLALDMVAKKLVRTNMRGTAMFVDNVTDALFYTDSGQIFKAFSAGRRVGLWKSAKIILPMQSAMAWVQVDGKQTADDPATVRWYGDGTLRHTATFTNTTPQRLPPGRWLEHEVEVQSTSRLTKVVLAGSTQELQSAQ